MSVARFRDRIEPMRRADVEQKIARWLNILDPKRNNDGVIGGRALHLAHDLAGFIRRRAKDQHENRAFIDRIDDGRPVVFARSNVARRNPARHAVGL